MISRIFSNWNLFRALRLSLGIFILIYGIFSSLWIFALFGLLFTLMPLFNMGCGVVCGNSSNSNDHPKIDEYKGEEIIYEEIFYKA